MSDLIVIVPSRGRPEAAAELAKAFEETCTAGTEIVFAVDADDPWLDEYEQVRRFGWTVNLAIITEPSTMVHALNRTAAHVAAASEHFAIGFMGDDHRPRTVGWDQAYLDALRELGTGIVYGDDLLRGEVLPTQCAMTADIVTALGYMAPPGLRHLYVDNFWRDLGQRAGCLRYLPDVVVEHMHPIAGKAPMDAGYERVNAPEVNDADGLAYSRYRLSGLAADVTKVCALRSVAA